MAVYVDDMAAPFGRMVMCHMIADSHEELVAMADQLGVARRWIQDAGTWSEHFDIAKSKKTAALDAGARLIPARELVARMHLKQPIGDRPAWVARVLAEAPL